MVRGVHKIYLSAILDLYDRRIVSYVISDHNDNPIVFDTFKATVTVVISTPTKPFTICWRKPV